ncbi:nucleotidyltransferase family protein [Mariniradius sediminis]|uniref:Nucleotidyltransferase domain-containing protein n=1 Tax=Mariniradius sediminis TaxID=2909237 RepID=A0ABS9BUG0_9BACT|nr:nucleotidyltransferase domain-containing protein [Mariniradius sediminis]MCF1751704.1 nucleotidyltransferase domain-containing protein [Mariniradius sediminis]
MKTLEIPLDSIQTLCDKHHVEKLYLFGSAAKGTMTEGSDVDLLVKFKEMKTTEYFENFLVLKNELQGVFGRKIDLVELQTLKNPVLIDSINQSKELIYG